MREHQMLTPGDRVVAGISGGADSVCLLFVLSAWKEQYGLELAAAHINHGIREDAGEDARFVEALCRQLCIPFYLKETDVHKLAEEQKCSEEEAGRNFRYQTFEEVAQEFSAEKIAVAHNLNDRSETMLFHLFRGSGIKGLAGIPPVRGKIIRPLLCVEREEIETYLAGKGQKFCQDSTNGEDVYTRNRIRHHILPYVEREIVSGCVRHMGQTAALLAETEDYLSLQTEDAVRACVDRHENGYCLDREVFLTYHPAIRRRVLFELVKKLSPGQKDISKIHVEELLELFQREGNGQIHLPFGICGRRIYGKVCLEQGVFPEKKPDLSEIKMELQVFPISDLPQNNENSLIFPQNQYTKWFDYDKMKKSPELRTRSGGDYLTIRDQKGELHHKKLKEYMVTEKIPQDQRDRIPVLAEDSHVIWLVGYRISEYYKVSENTKQVLQVQLITGCDDSSTEGKDGRTH